MSSIKKQFLLKSTRWLSMITVLLSILFLSTHSFAGTKQSTRFNADTNIISKSSFVPLYKYMAQTVRYPRAARENHIAGNVIVSFTLNTDGRVIAVNIVKGIRFGCDEEVKKALLLFADKSKTLKSGTYKLGISFRIRGEQLPEAIDPALKKEPDFLSEITITAL